MVIYLIIQISPVGKSFFCSHWARFFVSCLSIDLIMLFSSSPSIRRSVIGFVAIYIRLYRKIKMYYYLGQDSYYINVNGQLRWALVYFSVWRKLPHGLWSIIPFNLNIIFYWAKKRLLKYILKSPFSMGAWSLVF